MCDEFIHPGLVEDTRLSRRTFGLIAAAAAGAAGTACAAAPKTAVDESDVSIKTSEGSGTGFVVDATMRRPTAPRTRYILHPRKPVKIRRF